MISPGTLRFLLAFIVVLFHITRYVFLGHWAVYVFFMLSGYWVSRMYVEKYQNMPNSYFEYIKSRLLRLYPVNFLALVSGSIMAYFYSDYLLFFFSNSVFKIILNSFSQIFFLGCNISKNLLLPPAWSLDIELQFYILLPLIIYLIFRIKHGINILLVICFVLFVLTNYIPITYSKSTIIHYLLLFVLGISVYLKKWLPNIKLVYSSLILFFLIVLLHYIVPDLYLKTVEDKGSSYNFSLSMVLAIIFLPIVAYNVQVKSSKNDIILGNMSYIMYLFHWVFMFPYSYYFAEMPFKQRLPYTFGYLIVVVLVSYFIYILYDKPIEEWRKNIISKS